METPVSISAAVFAPAKLDIMYNVDDLSFQQKGKLNSHPPHFPHPYSFLSRIENSTSLVSVSVLFKKEKFKKIS